MRGKTITGATAVLIIAFYFLPWFSVSFNGRSLGQFSGYQLAFGGNQYALDGLNGRSILFIIPLSAFVILIWVVVAHYKPAWQMFAAAGEFAAASLGLLILVWQWLSVGGSEALIFSTELGLWLTLFSFGMALVGTFVTSREHRDLPPQIEPETTQPEVETIIASPLSPPQVSPEAQKITSSLQKIEKQKNQSEKQTETLSIQVWLVMAGGEFSGTKFQMMPPVRIGRDPGNDIIIDDNSMSGYHAVVREQGGVLHIQDLNSTNGIHLENQSNHRWQRVPAATLVNEMRIKLGRTVFNVVVEEIG